MSALALALPCSFTPVLTTGEEGPPVCEICRRAERRRALMRLLPRAVALLALVLTLAMFALSGCSSVPPVTVDDLDRLTNDVAALHSAVLAIDTSKIPDARVAHAIDDVRTVSGSATQAADLIRRLARAQ